VFGVMVKMYVNRLKVGSLTRAIASNTVVVGRDETLCPLALL
jgi:hypothetical protein